MARPMIEVKFDEAQLRRVRLMLRSIPRALPKVISRAINKTAAPVKTAMARQLKGPLDAKAAAIRAASSRKMPSLKFKMKTIKGNIKLQKATYRLWQALIWIKRFKGQEAALSSEPEFIAEMPGGQKSIFRRTGKGRLPIADQLRILMREHFTGIKGSVKRQAQERLKRNIEDQVKLTLAKWKAGAGKAA